MSEHKCPAGRTRYRLLGGGYVHWSDYTPCDGQHCERREADYGETHAWSDVDRRRHD